MFPSQVKQTSLQLPDEAKMREHPRSLKRENNVFNLVYSDICVFRLFGIELLVTRRVA